MICQEYVGPATLTGKRRTCSRPATNVYHGPKGDIYLCGRHAKAYRAEGAVTAQLDT